jgi:hypothetical protein
METLHSKGWEPSLSVSFPTYRSLQGGTSGGGTNKEGWVINNSMNET